VKGEESKKEEEKEKNGEDSFLGYRAFLRYCHIKIL